MEPLQPDHYWKTPFIWEPGGPVPSAESGLTYEAAPDNWLLSAVAQVMSSSIDASDRYAVGEFGAERAAADLLALAPEYFELRPGWWQLARDRDGSAVGFVLPALLQGEGRWRNGRPQGTIFYMGVLPEFRGHGHGRELLAQATRTFIAADCWRILCDTGTDNHPMIEAFRQAGYTERSRWQRSVK